MFLHDDNFNSRAPTFRNRSPTILRALKRADGVSGGWWWTLLLTFESVPLFSNLFESIEELLLFFSEQLPVLPKIVIISIIIYIARHLGFFKSDNYIIIQQALLGLPIESFLLRLK